jgi:Trypsin-like peptidase domain
MKKLKTRATEALSVVLFVLLFGGCASTGLTPAEQMMWSTYLIASPKGVATCVIVNRKDPSAPNGIIPVLVTSAHVLTVAPHGPFYLAYRSAQAGQGPQVDVLEIYPPDRLFVRHPKHDVAAGALRLPPEVANEVTLSSFLSEKDIQPGRDEPHPGDDISLLGFPSVFPGTDGAFPVLRSGRIASYSPGPATSRETFLINTNVYSGDSGGPVFSSSHRGKPKLLGILTERIGHKEGSVPLAVAINASVISETLKLEALQGHKPGEQSSEIPLTAQKNFQSASVRLLGPVQSLGKVLGVKQRRLLRLKPAPKPNESIISSARPPDDRSTPPARD